MTAAAIGKTALWTNKVEIADLDGDGRPDLLFANGGDYSTPGTPEPNQVFLNVGPGFRFTEVTTDVFGPTPDIARVIKARDLNGDGLTDIVVGTTYQTQSRLFLGTGRGRFTEVDAPPTCPRCRSASATSRPATWTATATSISCWPTGARATT